MLVRTVGLCAGLAWIVACSGVVVHDAKKTGDGHGSGDGGTASAEAGTSEPSPVMGGGSGHLGLGGLPLGAGGAPGNGGALIFGSGGSADGGAPSCAGITVLLEDTPVDLLVLLDQSVSMGDPIAGATPATTWWQAVQKGLGTFVKDSWTADVPDGGTPSLSVGITYFPLGGVAPESCEADYSTPNVEVAPLPRNGDALFSSLQEHQPTSFTPTAPALVGALAHMKALASKSGHESAVVLVTDGFPTECDPQDITDVAALVETAYASTPRIRTFVVGLNLGPGGENLRELSVAGGTISPHLIDGGNVATKLDGVFRDMLRGPLGCTLEIPAPNPPFDFSHIDLVWRGTGAPVFVPKLRTVDDCASNGDRGWVPDPGKISTRVLLCPETCADAAGGTLEFTLGCPTPLGR